VLSLPLKIEERLKAYADYLAERFIEKMLNDIDKIVTAYLSVAVKKIRNAYNLNFDINVQHSFVDRGHQYVVTITVPPETVELVKKTTERLLYEQRLDTRIRIKALRQILLRELESATGGLSAVLQHRGQSPGEGSDQAGGGGEEVRSEKGGSNSQGAPQGSVRGVRVGERP
jgi:hypothetical protein